MRYMKVNDLTKMATYYSGGGLLSEKVIRGVEESNGSVAVFRRDFLAIWNSNYPWVKVRTCPSMENFIQNCHRWE